MLRQLEAFPAAIAAENERNLPFLATTTILIEAVKGGAGRETAHEAIKEHAVGVALAMRETGQTENDLTARLGADERLPLSQAELDALMSDPLSFTGVASAQVAAVLAKIEAVAAQHPDEAKYSPGAIL